MCLGQGLIELQRFQRGSFCFGKGLCRTGFRVEGKMGVAVGESRVGRCVLRILLQGLPEVFKGQFQAIFAALIPRVAAL